MSKRLIEFNGVAIDPDAVKYVLEMAGGSSQFRTKIVFGDDCCVYVSTPLPEVVKAINDYYTESKTGLCDMWLPTMKPARDPMT